MKFFLKIWTLVLKFVESVNPGLELLPKFRFSLFSSFFLFLFELFLFFLTLFSTCQYWLWLGIILLICYICKRMLSPYAKYCCSPLIGQIKQLIYRENVLPISIEPVIRGTIDMWPPPPSDPFKDYHIEAGCVDLLIVH